MAASFEDNSINIFDVTLEFAKGYTKRVMIPGMGLDYPVTSFAWKPGKAYVLGAHVTGSIFRWTS